MRPSADMLAAEPERVVSRAPVVHDGGGALAEDLRGSVLLLGNFDGLHLGHRALLSQALQRARAVGRPLAILQFDPHPRHHFRGEQGFLISGSSVQRRLLAEAGIDLVYAPRFDAEFAAQPADAFVVEHLVARLGISAVVTGADFRFGQRRGGDVALLSAMGQACGFVAHVVGECRDPQATEKRISSSQVRLLIRNGRLDEAQRLLGRPFETAIEAGAGGWQFDPMQILPPDGIFIVEARGEAGRRLGRRMLVLQERRPEVRLPAATHTLLWHAAAAVTMPEAGFERTDNELRQS
jgi:riboflavin kinase/FMN adenylyltransferase